MVAYIISVVTDACLEGGGAFYCGDFMYVNWKNDYPEFADLPINYKEAAMAALCIERWAHLWKNRMVYLYTDNTCTMSIINKCSCRNEQVMNLLRTNFWLLSSYNVHIKAVYLPGELNSIADTISRLHEGLGQVLKLESIVNEWYWCHEYIKGAFDSVSFVNHMSLSAVLELQGIEAWRLLKWPWMKLYRRSLQPLLQSPPRELIGHS